MKNFKLGPGNKETGSTDFFRGPDVEGKYNTLQRDKKDMPVTEFQEFRNNCKMAQAERWNADRKPIVISPESSNIVSRYLAGIYPAAQGTAVCILDYLSGRRQVTIELDPNNIPVKHKKKEKQINLAFRDCEQLREKYVKKVSEKLVDGSWENLPLDDRQYFIGRYSALLVAMKFTNYYLKKLLSGNISKASIPEAQFQEAVRYDSRVLNLYQRNADGSYSLNAQGKPPSYRVLSQECATFLICKDFKIV